MKNIFKLLLILSLFATAACSSNSNSSGENDEEVVEEDADFLVDSDEEELTAEDEGESDEEAVEEVAESDLEEVAESTPLEMAMDSPVETTGEYGQYTVTKGDTLMMIAFKLYGDYTKWRSIAALNPGNGLMIPTGTVLKYDRPAQEFSWSPQGLPHLIRRGETLGTISDTQYGTVSRWKEIWANNKPMIQNPNLIFAGFTIYYIPSEDRDVASE